MRPMPFLGPSASTSASASAPVALQLPLRRRLGDRETAMWAAERTSSLSKPESPAAKLCTNGSCFDKDQLY